MDDPLGSGEFVEMDELERLRRRAYGPDADIAGDTQAQSRLAELEGRRRQLTAVDAVAAVPAPRWERVPVAEPADGPRAVSTPAVQSVDEAFAENVPGRGSVAGQDLRGTPARDGAPASAWWRRRRWLTILGAALASLGVVAGYLAGTSQLLASLFPPVPTEPSTAEMPPVPDRFPQGLYLPSAHEVLALRSVGEGADLPNDRHGVLESLGVSPDELRRYEDFDGLNIWSGESRYGMACLFVAVPVQGIREGYSAEGCSPEGFDTIAELRRQGATSFMRFVLREDHVSVYVYDRAANPSGSQG